MATKADAKDRFARSSFALSFGQLSRNFALFLIEVDDSLKSHDRQKERANRDE